LGGVVFVAREVGYFLLYLQKEPVYLRNSFIIRNQLNDFVVDHVL
jgi:hypothetical protein